jgi:hypothetical protein
LAYCSASFAACSSWWARSRRLRRRQHLRTAPNFRIEKTFLPILAIQRTDAEALAAGAERRGWGVEAARHPGLVEWLDLLISRAQAR